MKFYLIAASIFGLDEFVKRRAERRSADADRTAFHGKIILRNHHNKGICLNLFDRKQAFVTVVSALLTSAIGVRIFLLRKDEAQEVYKFGLSLALGGALSNTWDRIHRKYVVDYFSFNSKCSKFRDIVFNLSDLFLFAGAFLAVIGRKD